LHKTLASSRYTLLACNSREYNHQKKRLPRTEPFKLIPKKRRPFE
jgi:hypothetical protein